MLTVRTAHSGELDLGTLAAARALLGASFPDLTEHDWDHSLGGLHALAWERGELVGHAALVQRRLIHGGRALRAGYVEGLAVRADRRERGFGAALMTALEPFVRRAYDLGALSATDEAAAFYAGRGWRLWRGPSSALTPDGVRRTPDDDGGIFVLPCGAELDLAGALTCDWRDGDLW